ncbi:MAG: acyl-CoA thioesterase [Thaumarchaeota archaeon]|nr:acyl-CoA thioesterase [Candidatus Calditenuaceae archaeon]MDW8186697.1 thioesterase family protein [Nitrososphaerota archaeon]
MVRSVKLKFVVDFFDIDASGWINGAVYFQYNNRIFEELLRSNGYELRGLLERGYGFPPVHYRIDYKNAVIYGDVLEGEQVVTRVGRSSLETEFNFRRADGELIALGTVVRVFTDMRRKQSVPIPEELRERLLRDL